MSKATIYKTGKLPKTEDEAKYQRIGDYLVHKNQILEFMEEKNAIAEKHQENLKIHEVSELKRLAHKYKVSSESIDKLEATII